MTGGTDAIRAGRVVLGLELGSTRIKACLIDADRPADVLATGSHHWANELLDGIWTYSLTAVWAGVQDAVGGLMSDARARHGVSPAALAGAGVSGMMHGYLAFDENGELLVPFRTWRNTNAEQAAAELGELFGMNIPPRWSIAHLRQAVRDGEAHLPRLRSITTLAGYVHRALTGRDVLGVGDASGVFPIDPGTGAWDAHLIRRYDALGEGPRLRPLLPDVLAAGDDAGSLTEAGARLLDPTGRLRPGVPLCPPEGDAGTGMVATNAVAPGTGNVSVGTSVFAMIVLARALTAAHEEIGIVCTPAGDPVAMVHCNNGASELGAWAGVFHRFAEVSGSPADPDAVFEALLTEALRGEADAGGVVAFNQVAGEPILGLPAGVPLVLRDPGRSLTLGDLIRAQLYGVFAGLSIGMDVLALEHVRLDRLSAHGGLFRTAGIPQRLLASILRVPVVTDATAPEGGAWGMAVLAAFRRREGVTLARYLEDRVFAGRAPEVAVPDPAIVEGYRLFLERFRAALPVQATASARLGAPAQRPTGEKRADGRSPSR